MDFNYEEMIARIKSVKKERKFTNQQLSNLSDVPYGTLNKILGSETKEPSINTIIKIAKALQISTDYIVTGERQKHDITQITATPHEQKVITAYRKKTEMQPAVDKLLGIEDEEKKLPKISDTYKTGYATIAADEGGVEKVEWDKDLKSISDYYD